MRKWKIRKIARTKEIEKDWVTVTFECGVQWMPALKDMGKIMFEIGICEDLKYPDGEGRNMPKRFIIKAMEEAMDQEDVERIYNEYFNPNDL